MASLALSDTLGLDSVANGIIGVLSGVITIMFAIPKCFAIWTITFIELRQTAIHSINCTRESLTAVSNLEQKAVNAVCRERGIDPNKAVRGRGGMRPGDGSGRTTWQIARDIRKNRHVDKGKDSLKGRMIDITAELTKHEYTFDKKDVTEKLAEARKAEKDFAIASNLAGLSTMVLYATICDASFDIVQGFAAINNESYSSSSNIILITATWIGVAEEVIEGIMEILFIFLFETMPESDYIKRVYWVVYLMSMIEAIFGMYLVTTYDNNGLRSIGITTQVFILILGLITSLSWIRLPQIITHFHNNS